MNAQKANNFQRIRELTLEQQALLGATVLERMVPNYQLFSEACDFGDYAVVRNSMDLIWERICIRGAKIDLEKLIEKVEPNVPEIDAFDMFGVYPAIDTLTAMISLLTGLMTKDTNELQHVAKISQASVSKYVEYSFDCEGNEYSNADVREHPLMQCEMLFLSELIDLIETVSPSSDTAKQLKLFAKEDGITNIGIALD